MNRTYRKLTLVFTFKYVLTYVLESYFETQYIFFAHEHTYLNVLLNWESINKPLTGTLGSPFDFDISCSRTIFVGNYRNYRYFSIFFQEGGGGACGPTLMVNYGQNFQILSQNYVTFWPFKSAFIFIKISLKSHLFPIATKKLLLSS